MNADLEFEFMAEMREEWKSIPGFPEYTVSNFGRIRSLFGIGSRRHGGVLKPGLRNGYLGLLLYRNKKLTRASVHRVVCETFHGKGARGWFVRHIDNNKTNNRASNLCWGTPKDNCHDMLVAGSRAMGLTSGHAKLTREAVHDIRTSGLPTRVYVDRYGVSDVVVLLCKKRRTYRNLP